METSSASSWPKRRISSELKNTTSLPSVFNLNSDPTFDRLRHIYKYLAAECRLLSSCTHLSLSLCQGSGRESDSRRPRHSFNTLESGAPRYSRFPSKLFGDFSDSEKIRRVSPFSGRDSLNTLGLPDYASGTRTAGHSFW